MNADTIAAQSATNLGRAIDPFLDKATNYWRQMGLSLGCASLGTAVILFALTSALLDPHVFQNRTMSFSTLMVVGLVLIGLSILTYQVSQWRALKQNNATAERLAESYDKTRELLMTLQKVESEDLKKAANNPTAKSGMSD
jgi:hypothetical protein